MKIRELKPSIWNKPPLGSVINWSHPLTRGLVGCYLFNETGGGVLYDLAPVTANAGLNIVPAGSWDARGPILSTARYINYGSPAKYLFSNTSAFSIFNLIVPTSVTLADIWRSDPGGTTRNLLLWRINAGKLDLEYGRTDGTHFVSFQGGTTISATSPGGVIAVAAVRDYINAKAYIYLNGVRDGYSATDPPAGTAWQLSAGFYTFYNFSTGTEYFQGVRLLDLIYNRALSADEVQWLTAEPFAFFKQKRYYTVPFSVYNLQTTIAAASSTSSPLLKVSRDLPSAVAVLSSVSAPNLLVQRHLAAMAAILSETSDVDLLTAAVHNLITAIAMQSQTSTPALKVQRNLSSIMAGQTQTSTAFLARLMRLVSTQAAVTETSSPNLFVLRDLLAAITPETQTSVVTLAVLRDLLTAIAAASETSNPPLTVLRLLTASLPIVSHTPDIGMGLGAVYDMVTTMAIRSQTGFPLTYGDGHTYGDGSTYGGRVEALLRISRDLTAAMAGESATSAITMEFVRRLATAMAIITATSNPNMAVLRDLIAAIAIESQTSEIGFKWMGYLPESIRVRVLLSQLEAEVALRQLDAELGLQQLEAELSAPALQSELALRQLKGD